MGCPLGLLPKDNQYHVKRGKVYTLLASRLVCLLFTSSGPHSLMHLSDPTLHHPSFWTPSYSPSDCGRGLHYYCLILVQLPSKTVSSKGRALYFWVPCSQLHKYLLTDGFLICLKKQLTIWYMCLHLHLKPATHFQSSSSLIPYPTICETLPGWSELTSSLPSCRPCHIN